MIAFQDPLKQLPVRASTFAADVDGLYYFCVWVSIASFALILGLIVVSAIRDRRKREDQEPTSRVTHNTMLEVVWTLIPTVILMVIFAWGWRGQLDMAVAPGDALQYRATASMWKWDFFHPGENTPVDELYVPLNKPVKFTLDSRDVLHAFFVPAFRAKRDVVPGRYQTLWFQATRPSPQDGFWLFCAEYCGDGHSLMRKRVHVVGDADFAGRPWAKLPEEPAARGEIFWRRNCSACHTVDGSTATGPTFKGLWGREETMSDGSKVAVDETYVRESIRNPQAKIVKGYESAVMTPFPVDTLPDDQVGDIIEYLKTLKP